MLCYMCDSCLSPGEMLNIILHNKVLLVDIECDIEMENNGLLSLVWPSQNNRKLCHMTDDRIRLRAVSIIIPSRNFVIIITLFFIHFLYIHPYNFFLYGKYNFKINFALLFF